MFQVFSYAFNAIMPIILLIFLGWFLRKKGFFDEKFLKTGNRLIFRVVLPILIYTSIYDVSGLGAVKWDVVLYGVCMIFLLFLLGLALVLLFVKNKSARGVILQCTFRSNFAIIGLPLTKALGGDEAMQVTAVLVAFSVPLFNILAVIALSVFGKEGAPRKTPGEMLVSMAKNPLILSAGLGLLTLGIRSLIPAGSDGAPVFTIRENLPFLYSALNNIADATTFLSLVVLGGLLDFSAVKGKLGYIAMGTVLRVVAAPLIGLTGAVLLTNAGVLSCGPGEFACYIALFGAPVAISSAIMAAEMDGDAELARQLVVWTSVCPIVTVFAIVVIFRSAGLL